MSHETLVTSVGMVVYLTGMYFATFYYQLSFQQFLTLVVLSWFVVVPAWFFFMLVICPRLPEEEDS